jgi:hypothetical protein
MHAMRDLAGETNGDRSGGGAATAITAEESTGAEGTAGKIVVSECGNGAGGFRLLDEEGETG